MLVVPTQPVPSQQIGITLSNQVCQLNVYEKFFGLFMDVLVTNTLIIGGVLCENLNLIVRDDYLGFIGDFMFLDNEGVTDPVYTGLGARYSLLYLSANDLLIQTTGIVSPSAGILTGVPPTGATPGPGAPTQTDSFGNTLPWSAAIVAQFNGYQMNARVTIIIPGVKVGQLISLVNNNTQYPITLVGSSFIINNEWRQG